MLQRPLAPVEPPHMWSQTERQDVQAVDLNGQRADQGASAPKLVAGPTSKPKIKLTGIKIGGKQVTLPKAATPPPPAPLPEYVGKLVAVVKKANKLLKKPLQPLPEVLLSPPSALPVLTAAQEAFPGGHTGTSGGVMPARLPLAAAVQSETQGVWLKSGAQPCAAQISGPDQVPAEDALTGGGAPMDFHQWMLASKMAAERQRGPEQDVGRPQSSAAQGTAATEPAASRLHSAASPASLEASTPDVGTPPDQDPASPAGSCNASQLTGPLEKPAGATVASPEDVARPSKAVAQTSAMEQDAGHSEQQQRPASAEGLPVPAEAGPKDAGAHCKTPAQSRDTGTAGPASPAAAAAPAAVAAQLPSEQGRPSPAGARSCNGSSSSSSSSDDSSSSSDSSSSDSDTSSSGRSTSMSGLPLLPGNPEERSGSKATTASGGKRAAVEEDCGPSPKRHKPAPAGTIALNRLDSVREDGEIKGEEALRDTHTKEPARERDRRCTPEQYARGSSRENRDRERSYAHDSDRRRDEDDSRLQRRSDDYYKMHNWKYNRPRSREPRDLEDDRRRRDRGFDRGRDVEEERRRRSSERGRERERQEERRRRDDRDRGGSSRHSYEYRRRSRSRERSRRRRLPSRARSPSRDAEDRRRERSRTVRGHSRDQRTRSRSRDRPRRSECRLRDASPVRGPGRPSPKQERRAQKDSPVARQPSQALVPEPAATAAPSGTMQPPTSRSADESMKAVAPGPTAAQPAVVNMRKEAVAAGSSAPATPVHASQAQVAPASITAHKAQLSSQQKLLIDKSAPPATEKDPSNDLSDAARAFAAALRASIDSQAQEGDDSPADLHKQAASRKRLAKMFVEKGSDYERQMEALVAAGAEAEDCARMLREMCGATTEGIILTLKAQVHFLRWAAVGERMISQGRGMDWVAAVQDPAALAAKGMQAKHVLANEYGAFLAELQQRDTRQLFGVAKARFQRGTALHPAEKTLLSKGLQFIELARLFAMRLEMVTAVRTNAFQAPSLKQHQAGLRSVEDAHRAAQRIARQQPQPAPQLQQQRGAQMGLRGQQHQQQPSPRAFPPLAAGAAAKADAGETFQRPSPGDSANSETTASTPPTVQGLQQYMAGPVPAGAPGLPPLQAGVKGDYVIPQRLTRSQEVLLNSHQRFMTAHDLAASREIQLMLLTMMEDENVSAARAAALVSALSIDAALSDVMAVPTLGRQCVEGLRSLRDSLGLSPSQGAAA